MCKEQILSRFKNAYEYGKIGRYVSDAFFDPACAAIMYNIDNIYITDYEDKHYRYNRTVKPITPESQKELSTIEEYLSQPKLSLSQNSISLDQLSTPDRSPQETYLDFVDKRFKSQSDMFTPETSSPRSPDLSQQSLISKGISSSSPRSPGAFPHYPTPIATPVSKDKKKEGSQSQESQKSQEWFNWFSLPEGSPPIGGGMRIKSKIRTKKHRLNKRRTRKTNIKKNRKTRYKNHKTKMLNTYKYI
jgi:hypothetical protein